MAIVFVLAQKQAISPNAVSITRREVKTSNRKVAVSACVDQSVRPISCKIETLVVGFIRTICAPVINPARS